MNNSIQPVSYTNRKGKTYYLHAAVKKSGALAYVMRSASEGALTELPEGYVISENVNGTVSVGRAKPRVIREQEEALVAAELEKLGLTAYRCAVKNAYLTIHEPLYKEEDLRETFSALSMFSMGGSSPWVERKLANGPLEPVMRFKLVDKAKRLFAVERMTYRGDGGWWPLGDVNTLDKLARKYMRHLGKDSFFELM